MMKSLGAGVSFKGSLVCTLLMASAPASAQFDQRWVEFVQSPASLSAGTISDANHETDLAWGDLDKDGWTDLVVVRRRPFAGASIKRSNVLLMNESGVLTDRTLEYAAASDVPGDRGFLTPTNDRDVAIVDVDQDGWPDVVTATTQHDGDPKRIGHPRVYVNRGRDGSGAWMGLRYE